MLLSLFVDAVDGGFRCVWFAACAGAVRLEYRWVVSLLSGPGGIEVWARTFAGESVDGLALAWALLAFGYVDAFTATNALVLPLLSDDHDGDGLPDLVIDAWDVAGVFGVQFAFGFLTFVYAIEPVFLFATRAEVAQGASGVAMFERATGYQSGVAFLGPAGDAVGSDTGDLLWEEPTAVQGPFACVFAWVGYACADAYHEDRELEMLDGSTFAPAWTAHLDDPTLIFAAVRPALRDLTGDAAEDLVLLEWYQTSPPRRQGVVSGADGTVRWLREGSFFPLVLGPVGGTPGDDLLAVDFEYDEEDSGGETLTVVLERVDGGTGAVLLETRRAFGADGYLFAAVFLMGDGDADAVLDPAIDVFSFDFFDAGGDVSHALVESGAFGGVVFERSTPGFAVILPADNQDAVGGDDLLDLGITWSAQGGEVTMSGVRLPSGQVAWSRLDRFQGYFFLEFVPTGPQSQAPGADALYTRVQIEEWDPLVLISRIDGLDGRTGSLTWGVGDAFPEPSPGPAPPGGPHPRNDRFAAAVRVTEPLPFRETVDTTQATLEAGEPQPSCGFGVERTVWYRFTPARDLSVAAHVAADGVSTVAAVYTGPDLASLTQLTCSFDAWSAYGRAGAVFTALAGETYHLQLADLGEVGHVLTLDLDVFPVDVDDPPGLPGALASDPARGFRSHSEPHIAQSPSNPRILVAGSKMYNRDPDSLAEYEFKIGTYVSFDGGATWTDLGQLAVCPAEEAPRESWPDNTCYPEEDPARDGTGSEDGDRGGGGDWAEEYITSDVWMQFDDEGNAYAMVLDAPDLGFSGWGMTLHRWESVSPGDLLSGETWSERIPINAYPQMDPRRFLRFLDDKNTFAVNNAGPDGDGVTGVMVACWTQNVRLALKQQVVCERSTDGGLTWPLPPVPISDAQPLVIGVHVVADTREPNTFYATWLQYATGFFGAATMEFATSVDGGLSWVHRPAPVDVFQMVPQWFPGQRFRNFSLPTMAVGPGGELYIAYAAYLPAPDPDHDEDGYQADIVLVKSEDGGLTWTNPVSIAADPGPGANPNADQFQPSLAVTASGQVNVGYFDRRLDLATERHPGNAYVDVWLSRSNDGGQSFTDVRVSHDFSDPQHNAPVSPSGLFFGDYQGLVADDCHAIPFFNVTHLALGDRDPEFTSGLPFSDYQEVFAWRVPNTPAYGGTGGGCP